MKEKKKKMKNILIDVYLGFFFQTFRESYPPVLHLSVWDAYHRGG